MFLHKCLVTITSPNFFSFYPFPWFSKRSVFEMESGEIAYFLIPWWLGTFGIIHVQQSSQVTTVGLKYGSKIHNDYIIAIYIYLEAMQIDRRPCDYVFRLFTLALRVMVFSFYHNAIVVYRVSTKWRFVDEKTNWSQRLDVDMYVVNINTFVLHYYYILLEKSFATLHAVGILFLCKDQRSDHTC